MSSRKNFAMHGGKAALLSRITSRYPTLRSAPLKETVSGSSPPSVFIGSFGYPKVFVGPLLPPFFGDTKLHDSPEEWIPRGMDSTDVLARRLQLVRGKQAVGVRDRGKMAEMARDIALAKGSTEVEATFKSIPRGGFLSEEIQAFGPSADLRDLKVNASKWDSKLEKAFYDTDLRARDAVLELYGDGAQFSDIQRAFSVGAFGLERNRRFVPTRWSITAVDSTLSANLLSEIHGLPMLESPQVYEFESFSNRYLALFYPSLWQFEWIEAFFTDLPGIPRVSIFNDYEYAEGKKEYSRVGGCYYSAKLAALERLKEMGKQAGVLILREAYSDYVPLGVWNVRENLRQAVQQKPQEFESFNSGLQHMFSRLKVPEKDWRANSETLKNKFRQASLSQFI